MQLKKQGLTERVSVFKVKGWMKKILKILVTELSR